MDATTHGKNGNAIDLGAWMEDSKTGIAGRVIAWTYDKTLVTIRTENGGRHDALAGNFTPAPSPAEIRQRAAQVRRRWSRRVKSGRMRWQLENELVEMATTPRISDGRHYFGAV